MGRNQSTCYCICLRRATNQITEYYNQVLQPIGLTLNQFSLIGSLANLHTSTISELADYVGLERTTLTRTLKPLMKQGLIEDTSAPGTRSRALCLTHAGKQALRQGLPLWKQAQAEVRARLGEQEAQWLYDLADKLPSRQAEHPPTVE